VCDLISFSDTVSRCGIFCALVNGIERCKTEGVVDVFEAVKALRIQKPGSVPTLVGRPIFLLQLHELSIVSSSNRRSTASSLT